MEKNMKLQDFPINEENPFVEQAVQEVSRHIVKRKVNSTADSEKAILKAVNPYTGEELGTTSYVTQKLVDEDKFTKIYLAQFKAFFNLSQTGIRVFGYVMQCMKPSKDSIAFSLADCMEYTGYKAKSSIYKGMAELLNSEIIARSKDDWRYFINPLIVFNGNRVAFVNEYIKANGKAKRLEGTAKAERHKRIVSQAQALQWKINEEVFFNCDGGKEPARIIEIDTGSGIMTLLLYKTNRTVMVAVNSDRVIRRELTLSQT